MSSVKLWIYRMVVSWLPEGRPFGFKAALLRWAGAKVGKGVHVYSSAYVLGVGRLEIGDDVHVGPKAQLYCAAPAGIRIGSHVDIAPGVMILTSSHEVDAGGERVAGKMTTAEVEIGDGSWLGAGCRILPGVRLPRKTLVAAGAVVTESVPMEAALVAGVPATVRRALRGG